MDVNLTTTATVDRAGRSALQTLRDRLWEKWEGRSHYGLPMRSRLKREKGDRFFVLLLRVKLTVRQLA